MIKDCENLTLNTHPPTQFSITHDDMLRLYDREKSELMKLSKEELIEKLIGKKRICWNDICLS